MYTPLISQSLIKMAFQKDHCPKQLYYSFVEGRELIEPSDNMILGRYFESELLGCCRGGVKEPAKLYSKNGAGYNKGDKMKPFVEIDGLVEFARDIMNKLSIKVDNIQQELIKDYLKASIDLESNDIVSINDRALYDVKLTLTKEDDRWNGWGDPESKTDAHLQAIHYVYTYYKAHGIYPPFYFLVFGLNGGNKWVKVIRFRMNSETIELHEERIKYVANIINEYATNNWQGNGSFNKCLSCPFWSDCPDKSTSPKVETYEI